MNDHVNETEKFISATGNELPATEEKETTAPASEESPETETEKEPDTNEAEKAAPEEGEGEGDDSPSEDAANEETGDDDAAEPKTPKRRSTQDRVNKLVKQREDARREAERARQEIAELKAAIGTNKEPPKEDDYKNYDDYLDAVHEYETPAKAAEPDKPTQQSSSSDSLKTAHATVMEKIESAENLPDDFKAVAFSDKVTISPAMVEALADCDEPGEVLYHLGNNTELAKSIAGMSIPKQIRAIARLDGVKPPVKKPSITKASAPISPVKPSGTQKKSLKDMTFAEQEAETNRLELERGPK